VSETARADALLVKLQAMLRANLWARYMSQRLFAMLVKYLKANFGIKKTYAKTAAMFGPDFNEVFIFGTINPAKNLTISSFCHVFTFVFVLQCSLTFFAAEIFSIHTQETFTLINLVYFVIYVSQNIFTFVLASLQFYAKVPTLATAMAGILALLLVITVVSNLVIYFNFRFTHVMNKFFLKMKGMRYTKFK